MRRTILTPVLSILLAAVCAHGQGSCGVAGRVVVPGFSYDRYIEVLQIYGSRLVAYTYTDSTGLYKLPSQPTGSYDIVVRLDGFKEHKERVDVRGCPQAYDYTVYLEPEEAEIRPLILDSTGEVNEVVDVAELKRRIPKGIVEEFERARAERIRGQGDRARRRLEDLLKAETRRRNTRSSGAQPRARYGPLLR
jgi:hypothetical protein